MKAAGVIGTDVNLKTTTSFIKGIIAAVIASVFIISLPYIQLGVLYKYWIPELYEDDVDRAKCSCECWDKIFKGSYNSGAGPSGYKHVYFNITKETFKIWALTLLVIVVTYETIRHLTQLALNRRLRISMFILVVVVVYPHYYSWWSYFNAWNDGFYEQWFHQAFFSITELISTVLVVYHCDKSRTSSPRLLLVIIDIAVLHIAASGFDQFIYNVLGGHGKWHQVTRDLGFMVPDILHIAIPLYEIGSYAREQGFRFTDCFTRIDLLVSGFGIFILWLVCTKL